MRVSKVELFRTAEKKVLCVASWMLFIQKMLFLVWLNCFMKQWEALLTTCSSFETRHGRAFSYISPEKVSLCFGSVRKQVPRLFSQKCLPYLRPRFFLLGKNWSATLAFYLLNGVMSIHYLTFQPLIGDTCSVGIYYWSREEKNDI